MLLLERRDKIPVDLKYPSVAELIQLNKDVLSEIRAKRADRHQVLSHKKLETILETIQKDPGDVYDKATIMLCELIRRHPFASGTRRTALVATKAFLLQNGIAINRTFNANILTGIRENFYTTTEVKNWLKGYEIRQFQRY